jgi:hypothetical protein
MAATRNREVEGGRRGGGRVRRLEKRAAMSSPCPPAKTIEPGLNCFAKMGSLAEVQVKSLPL